MSRRRLASGRAVGSRVASNACRAMLVAVGIGVFHQAAVAAEITLNSAGFRVEKKVTTLEDMKRRFVVFQDYDYSCGAAVVATLLTYYFGEPVTEKEIILGMAEVADIAKLLERRAFSLLDMKRFAQARGYKAVGYKMDFDFLVELNQPVIVPINIRGYRHFVAFKGVVGDRVVIADPALGNYTMRVTRFLPIWTNGVGFVLERENPRGPLTEEDFQRQARFLEPPQVRMLTTSAMPSFVAVPAQLQSIIGPRPAGGSALDVFNIRVTTPRAVGPTR